MALRPCSIRSYAPALLAFILGGAFATGSTTAHAAQDPLPESRIIGGFDAKPCAWPSQVMMIVNPPGGPKGVCTGTLVHPKLILYSAHCGSPEQLIFGEKVKDALRLFEKDIESFKANPAWRSVNDIPEDFAYVLLKEPLTQVPTTPVAAGCERAQGEKRGHPVCMAGYSANETKDSKQVFLRWGNNKISSIGGAIIEVRAGKGSATACTGDSGGPLLHKLPDGSWRTMGITSTLQGGCGSPGAVNRYTLITPRVIEWVEKNSGIDIAPCFDAAGEPTPSAACDALMAFAGDPNAPKGDRLKVCEGATLKAARNFCKVPESGEEGESTSSTGSADESSEDSETSSEESTSQDSSAEPSDSTQSDSEPSESATTPDKSGDNGESKSTPESKSESKKSGSSGKSSEKDPSQDKPSQPDPPQKGGCQIDGQSPSAWLLGLGALLLPWRPRKRK